MEKTEKPVFEPMPETPAEPASTVSESAGQPAASLAEAKKNILVGLLWCVGGLAFSFISYYFTEAGGRYVIATGAILWGVWQAIMGLYVWLKIKHGAGEYAAFWRMLATAVCTALLIGYLTVYVLDGEWEFNIDALQDVFDPEAKSIADLSDYCASRDSAYYDGGIIKASRPLVSNGTDMLYSEGRRTEYPGFVFTAYDLKQGQSLITVGISYPSKEYGKTRTLRRVEELLRGIELTQPEETAGTAE